MQALLERAASLEYSYADLYSELHEQPFAYCDTYYAQRQEALAPVRARAAQLVRTAPHAVLAMARDYDAAMSEHYEADCRSPWRPYQNSARFQAVFTQDYPLYYLISEWRLTEVRLALVQIVVGWLGVIAIAFLSVYFWRSPLAPVVALVVTSFVVSHTFGGLYAALLPGLPLVTTSQTFLLPAVTVLLIVAMIQPALQPAAGLAAIWATVGLALVYGAHGLLYYVADTPVARTFTLVGLAYVGVVGLARRRWQVAASAVLAVGVAFALDRAFTRPGLEIYSAVTLANHLASDAYTPVMIYMGLFERPSPFGLFYMDEIFAWIINQDPVLVRVAPFMAVHQSYAHTGSALVWQAITTHPIAIAEAVFRRVLIQTFYRPLWISWTLKIDWMYTATFLALLGINAWAWRRTALFLALTPVTLCLLVNQFAVNTVMTLVHTNARWTLLGVILMFPLVPLYLFVLARLLRSTAWRRPDWAAIAPALRARPWRAAAAAAVLAVSVSSAAFAVQVAKQEREFVRTWMTVHQPPAEGLSIGTVVTRLEAMRLKNGDPRGEIAMWIVSILRMYQGRHPDMPADLRQQLEQWRETYYQQAIARAPDNPHYLYAAQFLQIDAWESYLLQGLQRFPDSVYASGAATALQYSAKELPAATREWVVRLNETLTGRFLSSGRGRIPGFEDVPGVAQITSGSVTTDRVSHPQGRSGVRLTMSPGAVAFLDDKPTHESPSIRFVSYMDLQDGEADSAVAFAGAGPERRLSASRALSIASQRLDGRYQVFLAPAAAHENRFGLWLRAGARGATIELRDYYPIVDYPKHYYRSGLMNRVRRAATRAPGSDSHS